MARYNEKKLTKTYGSGYLSDGGIPGAKFWITDEKSYTIYDPRNKNEKPKVPEEKRRFFKNPTPSTFVYRVCVGTMIILFLSTTFYNGRFTFLNGSELTLENEHIYNTGEITFYNYDFQFKLKQLSRLKPVLTPRSLTSDNNLHSVVEMNPEDYQIEFTELVNDGAIYYTGTGTQNKYYWSLNNDYEDFDYAYYIYNYKFYSNALNEYFGGNNARDYFLFYNNQVVRANDYDRWVKQYEKRLLDDGITFWGSTLALLTLPERLTYNIYVIGDFILRW